MNVGERITVLRKKIGLTTNGLANKAGVSQSYLREVEFGKKNPTVETLSYICDALNITLKDFFQDDENTGIQPFLLSAVKKLSDKEQLKLAEFINEIKS